MAKDPVYVHPEGCHLWCSSSMVVYHFHLLIGAVKGVSWVFGFVCEVGECLLIPFSLDTFVDFQCFVVFVREVDIKIFVFEPFFGAVFDEFAELSGSVGNAVCVKFPRVFLAGDGELFRGECSVRD